MNVKTKFKQNLKIKDLAYLNELGAEIVEFYPKNDELYGKLYVTGSYRSSKTDQDKLISEDVPFRLILDSSLINVADIDCESFEYSIIEGIGVDLEFQINLNYDIINDSDDSELNETEQAIVDKIIEENSEDLERKDVTVNNYSELLSPSHNDEEFLDNENEKIKQMITEKIDAKLNSKLELTDDNLPSGEIISRKINEEFVDLKIVYYTNERELEKIATNNNCSIESLFRKNKGYDIDRYHRVIINNEQGK